MIKSKFIESEILYDGSQLRSLYAYQDHGVEGDSIISFIGECNVANEHMVDGEDLFAGEEIRSKKMLHFIIELFDKNLFSMVCIQRLFASIISDLVYELSDNKFKLKRDGDDLFLEDSKLSISIASVSPVSAMVHFAVNISNENTPVKTLSLEDINIEVPTIVDQALKSFCSEFLEIQKATKKVFYLK